MFQIYEFNDKTISIYSWFYPNKFNTLHGHINVKYHFIASFPNQRSL